MQNEKILFELHLACVVGSLYSEWYLWPHFPQKYPVAGVQCHDSSSTGADYCRDVTMILSCFITETFSVLPWL